MPLNIFIKKNFIRARHYFFGLPIFLLCVTGYGLETDTLMQKNDPISTYLAYFAGDIHDYKGNPLNGGLSNNTQYIYTVNECTYVVRALGESLARRQHEISTHLLAESKGIAPHMCYYDGEDFSFVVLEFIPDHTLHLEQAKNYHVLDIIAKKLQLITQLDTTIPINMTEPDLFAQIFADYTLIKDFGNADFKTLISKALQAVETIYHKLEREKRPLTFNHNDMHPRNIFFTQGDIKVIDWETAAMNYELYDVACYSVYTCLNEAEDHYLLTHYLQHSPSHADLKHYSRVKQMIRVFMAFAFLKLLDPMPESVPIKAVKDFDYYMETFAHDTNANAPEFLYALALSFLQEFFKEYETCDKSFNSVVTLP